MKYANLTIGSMSFGDTTSRFMHLPEAQRHLYEIHTAPHSDLILSARFWRRITSLNWRGSLAK